MKRRIRFSVLDDIALLKEVIANNPFSDPKKWDIVHLNFITFCQKPFSHRSVKEHVEHLLKLLLREDHNNLRKSGSEEEYIEKERLLQSVRELSDRSKEIKRNYKVLQQQGMLQRNIKSEVHESEQLVESNENDLLESGSTEFSFPDCSSDDSSESAVFEPSISTTDPSNSSPGPIIKEVRSRNHIETDWESYKNHLVKNIGALQDTESVTLDSPVTTSVLHPSSTTAAPIRHKRKKHTSSAAVQFVRKLQAHDTAMQLRRIAVKEKKLALKEERFTLEKRKFELRLKEEERKCQVSKKEIELKEKRIALEEMERKARIDIEVRREENIRRNLELNYEVIKKVLDAFAPNNE